MTALLVLGGVSQWILWSLVLARIAPYDPKDKPEPEFPGW